MFQNKLGDNGTSQDLMSGVNALPVDGALVGLSVLEALRLRVTVNLSTHL